MNPITKKISLPVLLILVLIIGFLFAGTSGKIAGKVTDKGNGQSLPGVNVILEGTTLGATTDLDGYYVILNVPPGKYDLTVQYVGYQEQRLIGISVSIDLTTKLDFQLAEATLEMDEAIIVEGERPLLQKDITSSQSLVSSDDIEVLPVNEISDVLQLQSGVTRDAAGGFHIRGGRSTEIQYLVNGVSITDAYDNSVGLEIDNSSIQELQVISGTFNAEYGNAMSGIVNTVTKEGSSEFHGSLMSYIGDYVSSNTDIFNNVDAINPIANVQTNISGPVPFTNNKLTFFLSGRYSYEDGYYYGYDKYKPDGSPGTGDAVPLNWSERYLGQAKFAINIIPTIKLTAEGLISTSDYQDYDHDLKYVPDGITNKFFDNISGNVMITHTLSNVSFYTLQGAYYQRDFEEYLYENPFDSRYIHPDSMYNTSDQVNNYAFRIKGNRLNRFERSTKTFSGKFDFTSQITPAHLIKFGLEGKYHELNVDGYALQIPDDHLEGEPFIPEIPEPWELSRNIFKRDPYELAFYLQDKIELDNVIINIGMRMDYFYPNADVIANTTDPNINTPLRSWLDSLTVEERRPYFYKDAKAKWQVSPRFGIAYPISETGVIHFSYGHFLQIPTFQYLYNRSDYKVPLTGSPGEVFGNPDLEPQKTVQYEIGFKQEFGGIFLIDVTGFYKDIRDWISSAVYTTTNNVAYSLYINNDYANVKGITLNFKKKMSNYYAFDLNYTFQFSEGSNSSPEEAFNRDRSNDAPAIFLLPTDWDQRHLINFAFTLGGEQWGSTLLARTGTGLPYTPSITQYTSDRGISSGLQRNSRRRPNQITFDFNVYKLFQLNEFGVKLFAKIFNLFDTKNVVNVYGDSGKPDYTSDANGVEYDPRRPNTIQEFVTRPYHWAAPRQIQLGAELIF
ncbi:MAG: TonB-dependent receptor [Calditrichaceae bacterium]|nr:TonB-dependent receptor [Calditrichaceae bacterium]MBN2708465.1 TonB-dependent receptor [Calditrichaceae bacterium]RQV93078.1 MAG: TonB-dependent receptor [Calditrichota bacterium]